MWISGHGSSGSTSPNSCQQISATGSVPCIDMLLSSVSSWCGAVLTLPVLRRTKDRPRNKMIHRDINRKDFLYKMM